MNVVQALFWLIVLGLLVMVASRVFAKVQTKVGRVV